MEYLPIRRLSVHHQKKCAVVSGVSGFWLVFPNMQEFRYIRIFKVQLLSDQVNGHFIHSGRHHPVCLWGFLRPKTILRRKYLYGENKLTANFHVMWFISLLLLVLLRYPLIYAAPLVVSVLRNILSLTTENYLMNG